MKAVRRIFCAIVIGYVLISLFLSLMISVGVFRWEIISHRNPFTLVDVTVSEVEGFDLSGNWFGRDHHGDYMGFGSDAETGEKVLSIMVYNPMTTYSDDVIARYDVASWM